MVGITEIAGGEPWPSGRRSVTRMQARGDKGNAVGGSETKVRRRYLMVPIASLLVLALLYQFALRPAEAAFIILEVNPAVELGVDRRGLVVSAQGLDESGKALLAAVGWTSVRQRPFREVLADLTDRLVAENQVAAGGRVVVTVRAVTGAPAVQDISTQAREAVGNQLEAAGVQATTIGTVVNNTLFQAAAKLGFSPADYYELAKLSLSEEALLKVLTLSEELDIARPVFVDEMDTIAEAMADLKKVGLTQEQALGVMRAALAADPALEETSTMVAGVIDLWEGRVPLEQALAILALQQDPILQLESGAFLEEVTTLMAALADLYEAGISGGDVLALVRAVVMADPSLEESSTMVAGVIDLVEAGVTLEQVLALLALRHDTGLQLESGAFLEEVTTLMDALADLYEAGISGDVALALIRAAAGADPALREVDGVVDAAIELVEAGTAPAEVAAMVLQAIVGDPSMPGLEELLGLAADDEGKGEDLAGDEENDGGDDRDGPAPDADEDEDEDPDDTGADDPDDDNAGRGDPPAEDRKQPGWRPG